MKKIYASFLLASTLMAAGCDKKKDDVAPSDPIVNLTATMTGATQAPTPNQSTATGEFTGTYNKDTRVITYTLTYRGMTPTLGHFHQGAPGVAGPVSVPFPQYATSPIQGQATLSVEDGQKLLNNAFYANLHSAQYPGGELRGDIKIR